MIDPVFATAATGVETRRWMLLAGVFGLILGLLLHQGQWSWLVPVPLAGVFWCVAQTRRFQEAFWVGAGAGLTFFIVLLAWLPLSFVDLFGWGGVLPMPFLVLILAGFWGMTCSLTHWLTGRQVVLGLAVAFVLLEWLRGLGRLAFVWGTLGYALLPTPATQIAELGGVYLLSLLVTLIASGLVLAVQGRPVVLVISGIGLVLSVVFGMTRGEVQAPNLKVLLVQGSVSVLQKAKGRSQSELRLYQRLTLEAIKRQGKPDLVVFPEGAIPNSPEQADTKAVLQEIARPVIFGTAVYTKQQRFNSAFAWNQQQVTGRYDKVKLVPFGEFFPLQDWFPNVYETVFRAMNLPDLRGTSFGTRVKPLKLGAIQAGTYICYESTFPAITRELVANGANLLVNISNDAWFGATAGAEQHFQMGRLRAIETRRWIARSGNDGISAVIDPMGRVVERFERFKVAAFEAKVGLSTTQTPYVRFGDWIIPLLLLGFLVLLVVERLKF